MSVLPCLEAGPQREESLRRAQETLVSGGLVVLPTDTVYGIAADAFDPAAVAALLAAKGRGRQSPPPVLVSSPEMLDVLAIDVPHAARALAAAFWPGALTLVLRAQPTLAWDLGETSGTVALRMPDDPIALDLLRRTGPLAVSSANRTSVPPATTVEQARGQLGARVAVYLDGGDARGGVASTIVDATGPRLAVLREGAISLERLGEVVPHLRPVPEPAPDGEPARDGDAAPDGDAAAAAAAASQEPGPPS